MVPEYEQLGRVWVADATPRGSQAAIAELRRDGFELGGDQHDALRRRACLT